MNKTIFRYPLSSYRTRVVSRVYVCLAVCLFYAGCGDNGVSEKARVPADKTPFEYFVELSKIPRCSRYEQPASDYLVAFAEAHGLDAEQDHMYNVLITKPGSKNREREPPVILQAHIDMVCRSVLNSDEDRDIFPIIPDTNYGWVTSLGNRSTLGADNGGGVSMILAVLASRHISHPPIEALFTVQEELGLLGADEFDMSLLIGARLINIDLTTEKVLVVSSVRDGGGGIIIPMERAALRKVASFPDWEYRVDSPLRDKMAEVFRDFYGEEPVIAGINNDRAGIDCLVFADKAPELDMVSIGVDILNIHTVNERMYLASYNRVYDYLLRVLEKL